MVIIGSNQFLWLLIGYNLLLLVLISSNWFSLVFIGSHGLSLVLISSHWFSLVVIGSLNNYQMNFMWKTFATCYHVLNIHTWFGPVFHVSKNVNVCSFSCWIHMIKICAKHVSLGRSFDQFSTCFRQIFNFSIFFLLKL